MMNSAGWFRLGPSAWAHDEGLRREFFEACDLLVNQGGAAVLCLVIEGSVKWWKQ